MQYVLPHRDATCITDLGTFMRLGNDNFWRVGEMSPPRLHSASGNDKRADGIKKELEVLWVVRSH
jgi:hypothetical protein